MWLISSYTRYTMHSNFITTRTASKTVHFYAFASRLTRTIAPKSMQSHQTASGDLILNTNSYDAPHTLHIRPVNFCGRRFPQ